MALESKLRIAVVVDEESLSIYREWANKTGELQVNLDKAIRALNEHLRSGPPGLLATFDPSVTIDDEEVSEYEPLGPGEF